MGVGWSGSSGAASSRASNRASHTRPSTAPHLPRVKRTGVMGYHAQRLRATPSPWDITQGRLGTLAVVAADQSSHRRVRTPPQSVCRRGRAGACSAGPHQLRLVGGCDPERDWREHARSPPAGVAALCALHLHEALVDVALPRERPVRALLVLVDARRLGGKGGMELRQAREHRRRGASEVGAVVAAVRAMLPKAEFPPCASTSSPSRPHPLSLSLIRMHADTVAVAWAWVRAAFGDG